MSCIFSGNRTWRRLGLGKKTLVRVRGQAEFEMPVGHPCRDEGWPVECVGGGAQPGGGKQCGTHQSVKVTEASGVRVRAA